jgi:hypothetical protein
MTRFKIVAFLFAAMWLAASDARAQSVFETHVGWGSPGGAALNVGVAWFRVQNDSVEFQAILQGQAWQTASLQPVLLLPGGDLPFSFGTGQPFTVNMGFHYQNPFVPAPPFDPNAPVTANYFEGTLFSGSFQAFPGLESQLLSEAALLRLTYDNGSISGPLAFVAVPEPSTIVLLCVGTALLALRLRQARPQ